MTTNPAQKRVSSELISDKAVKFCKMSYDSRPLKAEAKEKLKSHLDHLPWKALDLEAIVDGDPSPKGIQKQHLEPIIRFLLIELG